MIQNLKEQKIEITRNEDKAETKRSINKACTGSLDVAECFLEAFKPFINRILTSNGDHRAYSKCHRDIKNATPKKEFCISWRSSGSNDGLVLNVCLFEGLYASLEIY